MVLTNDLVEAARAGDVATVVQWLNSGGDANERCATSGRTLLHVIASDRLRADEVERGRCDIARLLLARGAEVDAIRTQMAPNTPLLSASLYHRKELCELLCEAGADLNYQRFCHPHQPPDFPLWFAVSDPGTIRVLLRFGADPSLKGRLFFGGDLVTPEEEAARRVQNVERATFRGQILFPSHPLSVRLLADARLLRPRLRGVFALRALCHRGRAAPTAATPSAFARLIGTAPASKPRTRAAAKVRSSPGLPDPLAHLVCKFWLGSPPRRRRVTTTR